MVITFQDPQSLTGATPSEPVVFDYSHVYESTWECVDTDGNPVDISALSMPKWTLDISADEALSHTLFHTDSIAPSANAFQLVLAVFDPRIYGWMAGNVDKAAFVTISAYADFATDVPTYRFTMPCDMQCTSTFTCPGDLQRALLRELQAAVQRASDSAAYASAAASDVIDTGMVEIRAQADRASGYADSAEQASVDASNAADTASDEAVEAGRQATAAENARNEAVTAQGLAEDARDQAVSAATAAEEHASAAQSSADAASASAEDAATAASNANASAESASASALSAQGYSESASDYADNASDAAGNAAASASAASASAQAATVSAQSASADASVTSDNKDAAVIAASEASSNAATVVDYLEMALAAKTAATNAAAAAETDAADAHVWAEGDDDDVEALGGEHSARTWAQLAGQSSTAAIDAAASATASSSDAASAKNAAVAARNDAVAAASSAAENALLTQGLYNQTAELVATMDVGAVVGYGLVVDGTRLSFSWTDPNDVPPVRWYKTRLIMKTGGFPADETDGTVLVDETVRNQYQHVAFEYDAGIASDYYFALFTQSAGGVWNTGDDAPRFTTDALTWATIAMMTRAGTLLQYPGMAIGSVVPIQVNTLYPKLRYKLAHIDYKGTFAEIGDYMYDNTRIHNSIWIPDYLPCLGADNNNVSMMQFDAPETAYGATWDTAFITGKAYYTVSGETYTQLTEGTDYQDGASVADWQTLHGDTVYSKNHSSRVSNGNNIWKESNMRQWLNASGNDWFQKQNEYDVKSGNADYKSGWMTGFVSGFLDLVMPVYNKTARNTTATISGGGGGGYDITLDKFWLPSLKEFNGTNVNNVAEGSQFAYFRDVATTNAQRIQYDEGGTARACWLRSPYASFVYYVNYIHSSGASNYFYASNAFAFLPAMCIA